MNTLSTYTFRRKYFMNTFDHALRAMIVGEKICMVDRTEVRYIQNPYGTAPTTVVQAIAGTYAVAANTITDDILTVTDEFIVSEQIYDFEAALANFDLFAFRIDDMIASVANKIDIWVLNNLATNGTGAYTTPGGGFGTAANVVEILSNIASKVAGYADAYKGLYVVVENTDIAGIIQAQANVGFSFSDAALNNGFLTSMLGVDIYVVRSGTFQTATIGTVTFANAGYRVGGVKQMATYCAPRGVQYSEKEVSGKTGKEVVAYGYMGFKAWTPRVSLTIAIRLG